MSDIRDAHLIRGERFECPECGHGLPLHEWTECDNCGAHISLKVQVEAPAIDP